MRYEGSPGGVEEDLRVGAGRRTQDAGGKPERRVERWVGSGAEKLIDLVWWYQVYLVNGPGGRGGCGGG